MPRFVVNVTMAVAVEMTDELAARSQDAGWVRGFYGLDTPELIAEHLAWNLGIRDADLSRLDGFADLPDDAASARIIDVEYDTEPARPAGEGRLMYKEAEIIEYLSAGGRLHIREHPKRWAWLGGKGHCPVPVDTALMLVRAGRVVRVREHPNGTEYAHPLHAADPAQPAGEGR